MWFTLSGRVVYFVVGCVDDLLFESFFGELCSGAVKEKNLVEGE